MASSVCPDGSCAHGGKPPRPGRFHFPQPSHVSPEAAVPALTRLAAPPARLLRTQRAAGLLAQAGRGCWRPGPPYWACGQNERHDGSDAAPLRRRDRTPRAARASLAREVTWLHTFDWRRAGVLRRGRPGRVGHAPVGGRARATPLRAGDPQL